MQQKNTDMPGETVSPEAKTTLPEDFETALAELEALVTRMESGNLALEESLEAYARGVELARVCQQRLDKAEEHVKVLQGNLLRPLDDLKDES